MLSARTGVLEPRNAELLIVLASLDDIIVLRNGDISVSDQVVLLINVDDVDRWTVLLISQKGKLGDTSSRSLRVVIGCGAEWLRVVIDY